MNIHNAVIHRIIKEQYATSAELKTNDKMLTINTPAEHLIKSVRDIYSNKTGKTYGVFNPASTDTFRIQANAYITEETDFLNYTVNSVEHLHWYLNHEHLATGGYVLFVHYTENATSFLMVLMLNDKEGSSINPETFEVSDIIHLNLEKLHFASRINTTKWQNSEDNYITFIKGARRGGADVAQYFINFIGCTDVTTSKEATKNLLKAIVAYSAEKELTPKLTEELKHKTFSYCEEKRRNHELISLQHLSHFLDENNPEDFSTFANQPKYAISQTFEADRTTLKRLQQYFFSSKEFSIKFSDSLLGTSINYDPEAQTLLITDIPDKLKQQLDE